jgi:phosphate uptake regulator
LHDLLLALIARQGPVARDLRLAMALLHVNDRIERMGAQCVNIATLCRAIPLSANASTEQRDCLIEMARLADEQAAEAPRVFADRDPYGASALRSHDKALNEHNRRCFELAVKEGTDEARREGAFCVALMARALERFGDTPSTLADRRPSSPRDSSATAAEDARRLARAGQAALSGLPGRPVAGMTALDFGSITFRRPKGVARWPLTSCSTTSR